MKSLWLLTKRTFQEFGRDNCSQQAAAISYYVLFSLIPLLIFATSVFGFVMRDIDLQQRLVDNVVEALPLDQQEGPDLVGDTVRGVSRVSGALTVVGILATAWSSTAMFNSIRRALNNVWGVERQRPLFQQKLFDLAMVAGLGLLLGASVAGTAALRTLRELSDDALGPLSTDTGFFWSVLPLMVPAALTFLVFLLIYRYVPNITNRLSHLWPGALLATVLFESLKNGFAFYVAKFNNYDVIYGSLGAIMLFLFFIYLAANILLLGAELACEYGRLRRGEYAEMLAQPSGSVTRAILSYARGLFVHERPAPVARGEQPSMPQAAPPPAANPAPNPTPKPTPKARL
jgi:membrane protein